MRTIFKKLATLSFIVFTLMLTGLDSPRKPLVPMGPPGGFTE